MPVDFEKQAYWHGRFTTENAFEWLVPSEKFMALLEPHLASLDSKARILQLGFGTSDLHNHLRRRGFANITNVDYEPLAVVRGQELEMKEFGDIRMAYTVADVTCLDLAEKYDLIIDKSTVDAVRCGGDEPLLRMAEGVRKHLAPGAAWISLSYSERCFEVDNLPFDVDIFGKIPTVKGRETDPDIFHWCYLLRPKPELA